MRVVIAGGHGKIALLLEEILSGRGDEVVGLIRNPDHASDLAEGGAEVVLLDLETATVDQVATTLEGADAAVFAAGAGPGSGPARKRTVDLNACILLTNACDLVGVRRLLVVSAIGADRADDLDDSDESGEENVFKVYLQAKAAADAFVRDSKLEWTIVRPGGLTDGPATGLVTVGEHVDRGTIPRADVAAVLVAALDDSSTVGTQFELVSGSTPIQEALARL